MTIALTLSRAAVSKWVRLMRPMISLSPVYMAMSLLSQPTDAGMVQSTPATFMMTAVW
jgi:hypothetical protein